MYPIIFEYVFIVCIEIFVKNIQHSRVIVPTQALQRIYVLGRTCSIRSHFKRIILTVKSLVRFIDNAAADNITTYGLRAG